MHTGMTRALATLAIVTAGALYAQSPTVYDILLRGGTIVDGTGLSPYRADVAIVGGSIARLGTLTAERATLEIDATSLHVAPGFINIHSHATPDGLTRADNMLTQGVTTEILNADGGGPVDLAAQLAGAAARGLALNVGANIGFNSVWSQVVGLADRRPGADEIARMRTLVTAGLEQGAWGVSAGLDYKPAYFAQMEDVVQVIEAARTWRTNFTNHDRLTPESGFSARAGVFETMAIGERAGLVPLITHMKVTGRERGTADVVLGRMSEASTRGVYTAADVYPYLAGQTGLGSLIIPGWAQDGGRQAMLKRFADPSLRVRIVREAEEAMNARFAEGAASILDPQTKQRLTDVMRELQVSAGEAVVRLLEQHGNPGIIAFFGSEPDLVKILQHPTTSVACDCGAITGGGSHPRYYGSFPRVLGRYVREQKVLTLEDAIRKMTALPAATIGMLDRGVIAVGMAADVTVFDAARVTDHATFDAPTLLSEGIRYVIVNGRLALANGVPTGEQAGRPRRRTRHMLSRPMNGREARSLRRQGRVDDIEVSIDVAQAAGARHATGMIRVNDSRANVAFEMIELGWLQTTGSWASVTGRARLHSSDLERAVTISVDGSTIFIDTTGGYSLTGELRP